MNAVSRPCVVCAQLVPMRAGQRCCSPACRQRLKRQRDAARVTAPPTTPVDMLPADALATVQAIIARVLADGAWHQRAALDQRLPPLRADLELQRGHVLTTALTALACEVDRHSHAVRLPRSA